MCRLIDSVYEFIKKICIGDKSNTPILDSLLQQLTDIKKCLKEVKEELSYDKEVLLKELKKQDVIIHAMIEELPDMLWFKDIDGKYLYANKAIRDNLLFDDKPIGKTDIELAFNAKLKFGDENHTFGGVCLNSDEDVLNGNYVGKKYVESGKIKGNVVHLEVNKSVVELDGVVIGVVGSGRDITDHREELLAKGDCVDVFAKNEFKNKDS